MAAAVLQRHSLRAENLSRRCAGAPIGRVSWNSPVGLAAVSPTSTARAPISPRTAASPVAWPTPRRAPPGSMFRRLGDEVRAPATCATMRACGSPAFGFSPSGCPGLWGGFLFAPFAGRRRRSHPVLALGRRFANRGQSLCRRRRNIAKFTDGRFPGRPVDRPPRPWPSPPSAGRRRRPPTWSTATSVGLLLTDDDFGVQTWSCRRSIGPARWSSTPLPRVPPTCGGGPFTAAAAADAAEQWRAIGGAPATVAAGADADAVLAWARDLDLRQIVWLTPTTGPASDHLAGWTLN